MRSTGIERGGANIVLKILLATCGVRFILKGLWTRGGIHGLTQIRRFSRKSRDKKIFTHAKTLHLHVRTQHRKRLLLDETEGQCII